MQSEKQIIADPWTDVCGCRWEFDHSDDEFKRARVCAFHRRRTTLEVQNDTTHSFYVKLCRTPSGALYLHVQDEPSGHVDECVNANDHAIVSAQDVEL